MSFSKSIVEKLQFEVYSDCVRFKYDNWLGFTVSILNGKPKAGKPMDINNQKSLDYNKEMGPIYHEAYKITWDKLVKAKRDKAAGQGTFDF